MGKLNWKDLQLIYEGQFGVTADEASKWIAKELFTKNWYGTHKKIGRMWEDIENCISFSELLVEIEKFQKENNVKTGVAIDLMIEQKHRALKKFASEARVDLSKLSQHSLWTYIGMWKKQLTQAGFLIKKGQTYTEKEVIRAALKQEKRQKNFKLLVARSAKVKASRRK